MNIKPRFAAVLTIGMTHCCVSRHHHAPLDRCCVHMKQIENITLEISDKCKTLVVQATHSLCSKFRRIRHLKHLLWDAPRQGGYRLQDC